MSQTDNTPDTSALQIGAATSHTEALQIAETLSQALAANMAPRTLGNATVLLAPKGYELHDLTKKLNEANPSAPRKIGTAQLQALTSFVTYCADQKRAQNGYIYADTESRQFTAVFDDFKDEHMAGWRGHRATYKAEFTPEFSRWFNHSGSGAAMDQTKFAEFLEDNIADISEPAGAKLLEVASTLQAKTEINFSSARRLENGQIQLGYTEVIDARAGSDGAMTIPREFTLGLRIFKNGGGYAIKARLKYRLLSGSVKFWYELDRPERAIEDAFAGYIEQVRETSGYTVLIGKA